MLLIDELSESGFISEHQPFSKTSRDSIYKLSDEYSLFYIKFMDGSKAFGEGTWQSKAVSPSWKSWSGLAFENLALKHVAQIKKALGISGVYTEAAAFAFTGNKGETGFQIDLVLDRKDQTINLFEFKFYNAAFSIDKSEAAALRERIETFRKVSKTSKHIFLSFLTTFGVKMNENSLGLIDNNLEASLLFEP